jgi:hypothetical protein
MLARPRCAAGSGWGQSPVAGHLVAHAAPEPPADRSARESCGRCRDVVAPLGTSCTHSRDQHVRIAAISDQVGWTLAGPSSPARPRDTDGVQERLQLGALMALPGGHHDAERPAFGVHGQVQLAAQPAAGSSQSLIGSFVGLLGRPFCRSSRACRCRAPAACWWARLIVASTLMVHSTCPTASDLVWAQASSRSQVPSCCQRRNRS